MQANVVACFFGVEYNCWLKYLNWFVKKNMHTVYKCYDFSKFVM